MNALTSMKTWIAGGLAAVVLAVGGCTAATVAGTTTTSTSTGTSTTATLALTADHDTESDHTWDTTAEVTIDLSNPTATDGVTVKDGVITITAAGAYRLSGTLADGQVVVDTEDSGSVYLILDNASITNSDGSAIVIDKADLALIVLADGTTNTVTDGSSYAATGDDDPNAAIWSDPNLTILGEGSLTVNGNYNDGINSSDGLVIASGTVTVTAKDDGIRGKDYLVIKDGTVTVTSGGDALKSDNEEDAGLGYVSVAAGTALLMVCKISASVAANAARAQSCTRRGPGIRMRCSYSQWHAAVARSSEWEASAACSLSRATSCASDCSSRSLRPRWVFAQSWCMYSVWLR